MNKVSWSRGWSDASFPTALGRVLSGLLAVALATAVAVLAVARPAAAHGTLAQSSPAEGSTVAKPLTAVELYFTETVASNAYFTITAPGGGRVDNGWRNGSPKPLDKPVREYFMVEGKFEPREYTTGYPVVVSVAHLPAAGQYSVSYLSVASDGEQLRGTMSFRYTGPTTAAPKGWTPPTNQPDPALVAAAEQQGTSGGSTSSGGSAGPAASSAPTAATATASALDDDGGAGWVAWTGWAVAIAAAVAGFVGWRRRPTRAGTPSGRGRRSSTAVGSRGRGSRPGGKRTISTGRTISTRKAAPPASRRAADPAGSTASSGKGAVAAARRTTGVVTATANGDVATAQDDPPTTTADGGPAAVVNGSAPTPVGGGLSNTRLAMLAGGLVLALLAGFGLGNVGGGEDPSNRGPAAAPSNGPAATGPVASAGDGHQHPAGTGPHNHTGDASAGQTQATGTTVSASGYTLQPVRRSQPAGTATNYEFQIIGTD